MASAGFPSWDPSSNLTAHQSLKEKLLRVSLFWFSEGWKLCGQADFRCFLQLKIFHKRLFHSKATQVSKADGICLTEILLYPFFWGGGLLTKVGGVEECLKPEWFQQSAVDMSNYSYDYSSDTNSNQFDVDLLKDCMSSTGDSQLINRLFFINKVIDGLELTISFITICNSLDIDGVDWRTDVTQLHKSHNWGSLKLCDPYCTAYNLLDGRLPDLQPFTCNLYPTPRLDLHPLSCGSDVPILH